MPRAGSDALTEEIRAAVGRSAELSAAVERIAVAEDRPRAQILRLAVREYVARWEAARAVTAAALPSGTGGSRPPRGLFP